MRPAAGAAFVERGTGRRLVAGARASATVKKDRAALNTFLRWLAEHEHVPARQIRDALAVKLPRARGAEQRETPKTLSAAQYDRLVREATARMRTHRARLATLRAGLNAPDESGEFSRSHLGNSRDR